VRRLRARVVALAAVAATTLAVRCVGFQWDPADPMLHLEAIDPDTGKVVEMPAGTPAIFSGPDARFGTADDQIFPFVTGDVDLVVRSGTRGFTGPFPPAAIAGGVASLPEAIAEPFGDGSPVPFVVAASDGRPDPPTGDPVSPPSLVGAPILAVAFGDLDGDGFIGITQLDGNASDASLEEEELRPVGRVFAIASGGRADGQIAIGAGGPPGAELLVALGAAAYAGPFDAQHFGGRVPDGPMVMTQLPFLPRTAPDDVIDGNAPGPADPGALVGAQIEPAYVPQPGTPQVGERYTLRASAPSPSLDFARARSGALARFGLAAAPDPGRYRSLPGRPLRPGLDGAGARAVYEILQQIWLPDDGASSTLSARVVPLDRLGNVTTTSSPTLVTLHAAGGLRIVSPNLDGDPSVETVSVANARGVPIELDDAGAGSFDDPDGSLTLESAGGLLRLDVFLADPDVDDSGSVTAQDVSLVDAARGSDLGEPLYDPRFDLTGDGRIASDDRSLVQNHLGESVPVP
jgi:hypothetical protein